MFSIDMFIGVSTKNWTVRLLWSGLDGTLPARLDFRSSSEGLASVDESLSGEFVGVEPLASDMTMHMSETPPVSDGCGRELLQAVRAVPALAAWSLAMPRVGKSPSPEEIGQQLLLMLPTAKLCIEVEEDIMARSS